MRNLPLILAATILVGFFFACGGGSETGSTKTNTGGTGATSSGGSTSSGGTNNSGGTMGGGSGGGSAGAESGGGTAGGGGVQDSGACPPAEVTAGMGCDVPWQRCGYGTKPGCWRIWECTDEKVWQSVLAAGFECPGFDAGVTCPTTHPSGACPQQAVACLYGEIECFCFAGWCGAEPPPDGSAPYNWQCFAPPSPSCPPIQPSEGSACSHLGLECSYTACATNIYECTAAGWKLNIVPPPP
jgi:hypothetical protein